MPVEKSQKVESETLNGNLSAWAPGKNPVRDCAGILRTEVPVKTRQNTGYISPALGVTVGSLRTRLGSVWFIVLGPCSYSDLSEPTGTGPLQSSGLQGSYPVFPRILTGTSVCRGKIDCTSMLNIQANSVAASETSWLSHTQVPAEPCLWFSLR